MDPIVFMGIGNRYRVIVPDHDRDVMSIIDKTTSFWIKGAEFSDSYNSGQWDGKKHLYNMFDQTIPAGLLEDVLVVMELSGYRTIVQEPDDSFYCDEHVGQIIKYDDGINFIMGLRDDQHDAVSAAVKMRRGIIHAPTGTGKTHIAMGIMAALNQRTVFFAPYKHILKQTKNKICSELNVKSSNVGVIGAGSYDIEDITVCMLQSGFKIPPGDLDDFNVAIIDEAHHVPADTYYDVVMKLRARYIISLTATPFRADGKDMMIRAGCGPIIYRLGKKEAIDKNLMGSIQLEVVKVDPMTFAKNTKYPDAYRAYIVDNDVRNDMIVSEVEKLVSSGRQVYVHVDRIAHGYVLNYLIKDSLFISSKDMNKFMEDNIERFKSGEFPVLVSTLLGEGKDIPILDAIVLANGGKSPVKLEQIIGRSTRPKEDRRKSIVIDFYDRSQWFYDHFLTRLKSYYDNDAVEVPKWLKKQIPRDRMW